MKRVLVFVLFSGLFKSGFAQYSFISFSNTDLHFLADLADSSLRKIVGSVYLKIKPAEIRQRAGAAPKTNNAKVKYLTATRSEVLLDVSGYNNRFFRVPDSIQNFNTADKDLYVEFRGYLHEYLTDRSGGQQAVKMEKFGFTAEEKSALEKLKQLPLFSRKRSVETADIVYITGSDGKQRLEYFETKKLHVFNYAVTDYTKIVCNVRYSPVYADIYIIPKKDWVSRFNLANPPLSNGAMRTALPKLSRYKMNKVDNPLVVELNEKAYIVVFDKNGTYSYDHMEPSTIYTTRNTLHAKLTF